MKADNSGDLVPYCLLSPRIALAGAHTAFFTLTRILKALVITKDENMRALLQAKALVFSCVP